MKILRILLSAFFVVMVFFAAIPSQSVLANQADPDSTPTLVQANVYRNLIDPGDQLYVFYANIPYGVLPDALVTEAFIWRLLDTDNTTVLGQTVGYAYNDDGYGYNVFSMYFSASNAPTWDQPYIIRLSGNPSIFDTPPTYDFVLNSGDFSAITDNPGAQSELGLRILDIASDLQLRWALDETTTLIFSQETGTVLSKRGERFFRGAIFGFQAMAPSVFQVASSTITAFDRTWTTGYADNITGQYTGTFVATAQTAGSDFFGTGYDLLSIIMVLVIVTAIVIAHVTVLRTTVWAGMVDATLAAVIFARLGIPAALLTFMGLVGSISWVYISGKLWGVWR
tara:strand:- start:1452 stop:2468 length:1017 start_codon:yes stop_codon:yes gene_type:complete